MKQTLTLTLTSLLLLCLSACSQLPLAPESAPSAYRLDAGDTVQVEIYGQKELSGKFTLDDTGKLSLLKAGVVDLKGKTLREAEQAIAGGLKAELRAPEATVNIVEYRPIFVAGEVQRPGKSPYSSGMTVLRAVALAGGYTGKASRQKIRLLRDGQPPLRAQETTPVQPGDVIDVGESVF